jgi:sporulation protein YlmC with PRC-barrel domain
MRVRWHDLIWKPVVDADGRKIGPLVDLVATPEGEGLRVTALLVGQRELLHRIGWHHIDPERLGRRREIPWELVTDVRGAVHLNVRGNRVPPLRSS